ncbi:MAG TPA: amidohydrolase family protein [Vicinamibacterales bacterium]|nr:amidohydrolase family protein [Vicinamibacterales bacterium]
MQKLTSAFVLALFVAQQPAAPTRATVVRAGRLIDPATGTAAANQTIVVQNGRITAIGSGITTPAGAEVIDLSNLSVLPGLVDAHNHLALTYKTEPESNYYYLTYVMDSTALRAIQAVSNGMQMMSSGFTVVRDLGNAGNYADTALRVAIEQGWVPGPTIINSGIIIGGMGGQFTPTPEMAKDHNIVYPEYLDADTHDEIVKAVRQNILFGAKVIKVCVDCKPYPYTVDDLRTFVAEAANAGLKVAGHVQTKVGAMRAIEAGFWSLEHSGPMDDEVHKLMAQKGIWRVGTETPFTPYRGSQQAFDRTVAGMKNAYAAGVKMAFSTDADYFIPGMNRGEVVINFLLSWKASGIPAKDILKIMTINGYEVCDIASRRGPIKVGFPADMIAVGGNPLDDIDALRTVSFVMKDGMVFKKDGVVVPEKFLHAGPVNGWRIR